MPIAEMAYWFISFPFVLVLSVTSLHYSRHLFSGWETPRVQKALICILCSLASTAALVWLPMAPAYLCIYLCMLVAHLLLWHADWKLNIFLANAYLLNIIIFQMLSLTALSVLSHRTIAAVVGSRDLSQWATILTCLILIASIQLAEHFIPMQKMRKVAYHRHLRRGMSVWMCLSNIYILLQSPKFCQDTSPTLQVLLDHVLLCILFLFASWAFLFYNIRIATLLRYEEKYDRIHELKNALTEKAVYRFEFNLSTNEATCEGDDDLRQLLGDKLTYESLANRALEKMVAPIDRARMRRFLSPAHLEAACSSGRNNLDIDFRLSVGSEATLSWFRANVVVFHEKQKGQICGYVYIFSIDTEKREHELLQRAASRDGLTGLLNKTSAIRQIEQSLSSGGALFIIDIDNFKQINDTCGHAVGDQFLTHVSDALQQVFREEDVLGRFGGDEFIAFMKVHPDKRQIVEEKARLLCERCRSFSMECKVSSSVSVGVAYAAPGEGFSFNKVFSCADDALYASKRAGKSRYEVVLLPTPDELG